VFFTGGFMMNTTQKKVYQWLSEGVSKAEIARRLKWAESTLKSRLAIWVRENEFIIPTPPPPPPKEVKPPMPQSAKEAIKSDRKIQGLTEKERVTKKKYKALLAEVEILEAERQAIVGLHRNPKRFVIKKSAPSKKSEATYVGIFSDWHIEEEVTEEQTSGLSKYNLDISRDRASLCFSRFLRLIEIEQQNTPINTAVVALLGDFISGDIHEDTSKSALLEPTFAIVRARDYISSGIRYLLENSDLNLKIVCHTGNHGRKGMGQLIANEAGNSLEYLMYHFLAAEFKDEKRVEFYIPHGYHSYLTLYDNFTIRFHHGHAIRYGGGIGGITIPVNKAISAWNEGRKADLDCFGHFHQALDGETFICNGSMIGYNAYGLYIKAKFQEPKQMCFAVHSRLGKILTRPILFK
jgi:hypothetical protein